MTVGASAATASRVPMRLTAAEPATVGTQDMVMLSAPASALGSAFPVSATPMSASGAAALGGTAAGNVPMTGVADTGNGMFQLTGPWMPETAGDGPHLRAAPVHGAAARADGRYGGRRLHRGDGHHDHHAGHGAGGREHRRHRSASAPAAAPGAPDTGGGGSLHPGSDLPLAAGGAAAVLAGLAITLYTLRRRRGLTS